MKQYLVSIITPLFNRRSLIEETWLSIFKQKYTNWEWLVIDDGSTDDGPEFISALAEKYTQIKLLYRKDGIKGPSRCRNIGAKMAVGNFIMFLDSDDIITEECLANRICFFKNKPHLDFAVFTQQLFRVLPGDCSEIFNKYFNTSNEYLQSFLKDEHPWQTSGPLWKKEAFIKIGGFNENYNMMEDPELHIRALLSNLQFEVTQGLPDFYYRQSTKTQEQEKLFWNHSIMGRIQFFKDIKFTLDKYEKWNNYKNDISIAYINFQKYFLLWRAKDFINEYQEIKHWERNCHLISNWKSLMIETYFKIIIHDYFKKIPLKYIIHKWI